MKKYVAFFSLLSVCIGNSLFGGIPAFPGAEGGGSEALGGRFGTPTIYHVTTLADSGVGSLRAALETSGPRIIVFDVSGEIISNSINISNPYVTVAGQTAPGQGITIRGKFDNVWDVDLFRIMTHDVVIRNLRFRFGKRNASTHCIFIRDYNGQAAYNVVIDRCSLSWAEDEILTLYASSQAYSKITVSNSIIAEGLHNVNHDANLHSAGAIVGMDSNADQAEKVSFHHNYVAHNWMRSIYTKILNGRYINNIAYNYGDWAMIVAGGMSIDIIGNHYKMGLSYIPGNPWSFNWESTPGDNAGNGVVGSPSILLEGNIGYMHSDPVADNWNMIKQVTTGINPVALSSSYRRYTKLSDNVNYPIKTIQHVNDIQLEIFGGLGSGASYRLNEFGVPVANRDTVDHRVIDDFINDTGEIIFNESDVGGFPTLIAGTANADSDNDGMPDAYEDYYGFNKTSSSDALADTDGDGYLNLEEFINGSNPLVPEGFVNLKLNEPQGIICKDSSGHVNVGELVNAPVRCAGICNRGLNLDGNTTTTQYIKVPGALGGMSQITIAAWVNFDTINRYDMIAGKSNCFLLAKSNNGQLYFNYSKNGSSWDGAKYQTVSLTAGQWCHVAVTYNSSSGEVKFFVDGTQAGTTSTVSSPGAVYNSSADMEIGRLWSNWAFKGKIDEVRVIDKALTSGQITELYDSTSLPKPAFWAAFDEGSGNSPKDMTGNTANGTLYGDTKYVLYGQSYSAMTFDGSTDYITYPDSTALDVSNAITIGTWIKFNANPATYQMFAAKSGSYLFGKSGNTLYFNYSKNGSTWVGAAYVNYTFTPDLWYHVAATYDSSNGYVKIYVNGKQIGNTVTVSSPGTIYNSSSVLTIGYLWSGWSFSGCMDEFKIFGKALSGNEIITLMRK